MSIEIKVPQLPESIADATVLNWYKKPGDTVHRDENLVDIETDKVVLEVPAPADGVLKEIRKENGTKVLAKEIIGVMEAGAVAQEKPAATAVPAAAQKAAVTATISSSATTAQTQQKAATSQTSAPQSSAPQTTATQSSTNAPSATDETDLSPAVRRLVAEHGIDTQQLKGTGKDGRITREDVINFVNQISAQKTPATSTAAPVAIPAGERTEQRVPMSRLRARIAERLLSAQHNAAILTTFNEINLQDIINLRTQYKDEFEKVHGVRLGFMSFFTKACIEALKRFPMVNASIDGTDVVYHGYYDIGVAVSTDRGLVVPVLRNAERMSLADIEKQVGEYGRKARDNQLTLEEMTGGTFTITNGGVFGSLLSTPIINPPQCAILGMHKIEERPIVEKGQIVIRPMMYVALSYDHRLIDGRDSVRFLVAIKEFLEHPARLLLDI